MRRRLVLVFTLLCICWQSLAYAGSGVVIAHDEEEAHALLHFEGQAHHHHDDGQGDFDQDESLDSVQHAMHDAGLFPPALMHLVDLHISAARPDEPVPLARTQGSTPFLRGLDRPPKTLS